MPHEFLASPEIVPSQELATTREHKARTLCQSGTYEAILADFDRPEHAGLLEGQIDRLKQTELREASPMLREHDWEMLTILELFDRATFEHCVRTYTIAKQKIESTGPVGLYLREQIAAEGLSPWDIELACLLHDMGKIVLVPKDLLLNNTLSNKEWHRLFEQFCHDSFPEEEAVSKIQSYEQQLKDSPLLREKDLTPLSLGLTEEEQILLRAHGFESELPLGTILAQHQDASVAIAERYYPTESHLLSLIGNHHERPLGDLPDPVSQSVVRLSSLIAALRLADTYDAYRSLRPYKSENSPLATLAFLATQAELGSLDRELTQLWIVADLAEQGITDASFTSEEDRLAYEKIQVFLAS